jgi:hypothetical protein
LECQSADRASHEECFRRVLDTIRTLDRWSTQSSVKAARAAVATQGCRAGNPLTGVYHPRRLKVLASCVAITGVVKVIRHEQDGDYHVNVALDAPFRSMLNAGNVTQQHGYLVTEIIPEDAARGIHPPRIGTHVRVVGP